MITVDCSNALAIKDKLLVYVADKLEALPILKSGKFILDSWMILRQLTSWMSYLPLRNF